MTTIFDTLQNADHNIKYGGIAFLLGKEQLHNAVTLLEKGYGLYDDVEELLSKYGGMDNASGKE